MKNQFKLLREYARMVDEHEKYIREDRGRNLVNAFKEIKREAEQRWERENPPKFKYGDLVEVGIWETTKISTGKYFRPAYSGKIVSIVREETYLTTGGINPFIQSDLKHHWKCEGFRIYCIDTGDLKYHEARESEMQLKQR